MEKKKGGRRRGGLNKARSTFIQRKSRRQERDKHHDLTGANKAKRTRYANQHGEKPKQKEG